MRKEEGREGRMEEGMGRVGGRGVREIRKEGVEHH